MKRGELSIYMEFQCCGLGEMGGISSFDNPEMLCKAALSYRNSLEVPIVSHLIFTQASGTKRLSGYGYNLAKYIIANGLGHVAASEPGENPNSGNYVTVFVWTLNERGIRRWAKKQGFAIDE